MKIARTSFWFFVLTTIFTFVSYICMNEKTKYSWQENISLAYLVGLGFALCFVLGFFLTFSPQKK